MGFYSFEPNKQRIIASERRPLQVEPGFKIREKYSSSRMLSYTQPRTGKGLVPKPVNGLTQYSDSHLASLLNEAKSRNKERRAERIMRILQNRASRKRKREKGIPHDRKLEPLSCYHEKYYAEQKHWEDYPFALPREYNPYKPGYIYCVPGGQYEFPHENLQNKISNLPLEEIVSAALARLSFNIKPRAKDCIPFAVNFFQQLIEMRENLALPTAFRSCYKNLLSNNRLADGVAESWLTANWGVLPLSNDMQELYMLFSTFKENIENWNNNLTRVLFRRRRRAVIPLQDILPPETVTAGGQNTSSVMRRIEYTVLLEVYYTVRFYPLPISGDDMLGILADRLGLMRPLSGLWEGVPWSWLIDYGVGVGDWLASKEPEFQLPMKSELRIESIKFICTEKADLYFKSALSDKQEYVVKTERFCRYEFYRRLVKPGIINHYSGIVYQPKVSLSLGKGLNAKRLANLASVIQLNTSARLDAKDRKFLQSVKRAKYFKKVSKRAARKNMKVLVK